MSCLRTNKQFDLAFHLLHTTLDYYVKMVEIFLGASHMINNNIFNIFSFSTFSLGDFTNPAFWLNFKKIALKTGLRKYLREKVEKLKMLKMLLFIICEAPMKIPTLFWPFLAIFTLFHLTNLL